MRVTYQKFEEAGRAACRQVWRDTHAGTDWDRECPNKAGWLREELDALRPALEALGLTVDPAPEILEGELK